VKPFYKILIALPLIVLVAASCGKKKDDKSFKDDPKTAEDYVKRATDSFLDKDKALKDLNKAIELDKDCVKAYEMRAEIYESRYNDTGRDEDAKRAIADYGKAIKLEPESPQNGERYRRRGILHKKLEEWDTAIAELRSSIKRDKYNVKTYEHLAECYVGTKDFQMAIKTYGYAIRYDSKNASLYKDRARVYFRIEDTDHAIKDLGMVIKLAPDAEAYGARAQIYREIGEPGKAIDDYEKARELDPSMREGGTVW